MRQACFPVSAFCEGSLQVLIAEVEVGAVLLLWPFRVQGIFSRAVGEKRSEPEDPAHQGAAAALGQLIAPGFATSQDSFLASENFLKCVP